LLGYSSRAGIILHLLGDFCGENAHHYGVGGHWWHRRRAGTL